MMTLPFNVVGDYCANHSTPTDDILNALERETHLKTIAPQMLSGRHQGKFLEMLSTVLQPKRILEIGSFTGYSAICLGRGLAPDGTMDCLELNPEYAEIFHRYIGQAGLSDKITLHNGDARQIFPKLNAPYDLVFIDAGKQEYPEYFNAVMELVRKNGLILIDNMLWDGKVMEETDDLDTIVLRDFANALMKDKRVEVVMLPLRDGITMVRKV